MTTEPTDPAAEVAGGDPAAVQTPEFSEVRQPVGLSLGDGALSSVYDVGVTVTAELGRVSMPISELLELSEGAVVELGRPVSAPVDIRVHGVLLARGEVVVVDDSFAVRLTEVTESKPGSAPTKDVA